MRRYILYLHHNPDGIPHFHATCQGQESIITLPDCTLREGNLPANKLQQLQEWVGMHGYELMANRKAVRYPATFDEQEEQP